MPSLSLTSAVLGWLSIDDSVTSEGISCRLMEAVEIRVGRVLEGGGSCEDMEGFPPLLKLINCRCLFTCLSNRQGPKTSGEGIFSHRMSILGAGHIEHHTYILHILGHETTKSNSNAVVAGDSKRRMHTSNPHHTYINAKRIIFQSTRVTATVVSSYESSGIILGLRVFFTCCSCCCTSNIRSILQVLSHRW